MNILPRETRLLILKLICRRCGINDIVDITGCSPTTVRAQLALMGEACAALHDRLVRGISPSRIELDELWSYVYVKRDSNLRKRDRQTELGPRRRQPPAERGKRFTWIAFDPDSKVVASYYTGDRGMESGVTFLSDLNHRIENRPLFSSDAHHVYEGAIQHTFGAGTPHVTMQKVFKKWFSPDTRESGNVLIGLTKIANAKGVDVTLASTSHVERMNSNIRHFAARFGRQTYRFSKKMANHHYALAIIVMYYNFVRSHFGFNHTVWKNCPPAMAAGLSQTAWSYDDLLDQIDGYWAEKNAIDARPTIVHPPVLLPEYIRLAPGIWSDNSFFVSYSRLHNTAKVHVAHCRDCRRAAAGRKEGPKANEWYAFDSQGSAFQCAETLAPLNASVCSICILGKYPGSRGTQQGPKVPKTIN